MLPTAFKKAQREGGDRTGTYMSLSLTCQKGFLFATEEDFQAQGGILLGSSPLAGQGSSAAGALSAQAPSHRRWLPTPPATLGEKEAFAGMVNILALKFKMLLPFST